MSSLSKIGCLGKRFVLQQGEDLLNSIRETETTLDTSWPTLDKGGRMTIEQEALVKKMLNLVRQNAKSFDLVPSLLATRKDIEAIVQGRPEVKAMNGWRFEVVGKSLLELAAAQTKQND